MVDTNNAGRLGAGFISVCLETRWLGHFGGFYVPEPTIYLPLSRPFFLFLSPFPLRLFDSLSLSLALTLARSLFLSLSLSPPPSLARACCLSSFLSLCLSFSPSFVFLCLSLTQSLNPFLSRPPRPSLPSLTFLSLFLCV